MLQSPVDRGEPGRGGAGGGGGETTQTDGLGVLPPAAAPASTDHEGHRWDLLPGWNVPVTFVPLQIRPGYSWGAPPHHPTHTTKEIERRERKQKNKNKNDQR